MAGYYSSFRFDPTKNFSAVLNQMGKVQLDSDWNEFVGILERGFRTTNLDTFGKCSVPKETPNGFEITLKDGQLMIGPGRIYVDGLQAENHGFQPEKTPNGDGSAVKLELDPILGEQRSIEPVPFNRQPYRPGLSKAEEPKPGGSYLVYGEFWRREVTHLQADLIEKAIGIDTTTRWQTVWQVKTLQVDSTTTCESRLEEWEKIIRPSTARLSTQTVGVPSEDDPCLLPPSGGYRGLENRLYRVELHDGGFKWSGDNASSATTSVIEIEADKITVSSSVAQFHIGDWVEITDDWREFSDKPGDMARIKGIMVDSRVLVLASPIAGGDFKPADPSRHTRIIRWDQQGRVLDTQGNLLVDLNDPDSKGVIPIPSSGVSVVLEHGVQVTLIGSPHLGDYWVFAARTADGSVEILDNMPPKEIRHYCPLAIATIPNADIKGSISNCRRLWPPDMKGGDCECTICVSAESHKGKTLTIQMAIDKVIDSGGGTVCLGPGTYDLGESPSPITINSAQSLRLRGHGVNTNLVYKGRGPALAIDRSAAIMVEELMITASRGNDPSPVLAVTNSTSVTLQRNVVVQLGDAKFATPAIGLGGILIGTDIRENALFAPVGVGNILVPAPAGIVLPPQPVFVTMLSLHVEHNVMFNSRRGISLVGMSVHMLETRLAENFIRDCPEGGIVALGFVVPGFGVDVRSNEILAKGSGIVIGVSGARISGNSISPVEPDAGGSGIILTAGLDNNELDGCQVVENRIFGLAGDGIAINGAIKSAMIKNNIIQSVDGGGIVMDDKSRAKNLTIENNQLLEITPKEKDQKKAVAAIRVVNAAQVGVGGNAIVGVGRQAFRNPSRAGIQLIACATARVAGNEIADIGPMENFLNLAAGVECLGTFDHLDVGDNNIRRNQIPRNDPDDSKWSAVVIRGAQSQPPPIAGGSKWVVGTKSEILYLFLLNKIIAQTLGRELADLKGNYMDVYGTVPAIEVQVSGACALNHNRALLKGRAQPVADVQAGSAIAMANDLRAQEKVASLSLKLPVSDKAAPFTALGNITTSPITVQLGSKPPTPLEPPWSVLNFITP